MALTFTEVAPVYRGAKRVNLYKIDLDNSYPSNGEAVTASDLGLVNLDFVAVLGSPAGYKVEFDVANSKLKVFATSDATTSVGVPVEAKSTSDLSAVDVYVLAIGN